MLCVLLSVKSLEKHRLLWSVSAGTVKGCSWNDGFKDNIQAFSLGHDTLVSQVGFPLKFCPQNRYLKTQAQCVGDKLGLNLTPKTGKMFTWRTRHCIYSPWKTIYLHQTTRPASWETCMQVRKPQLEMDMEQQTGSKQEKEYVKAVYCHPAYLTSMQSTSWEMLDWKKHKLESRLLGEISITSHMEMTPPLWQKVKRN